MSLFARCIGFFCFGCIVDVILGKSSIWGDFFWFIWKNIVLFIGFAAKIDEGSQAPRVFALVLRTQQMTCALGAKSRLFK